MYLKNIFYFLTKDFSLPETVIKTSSLIKIIILISKMSLLFEK